LIGLFEMNMINWWLGINAQVDEVMAARVIVHTRYSCWLLCLDTSAFSRI